MFERIRSRSQDDRGAVLVIVAVSMVAFMALAALAIDLGSYYQAQRKVQAAADAGALAAAADLSSSPGSVTTDGTNYAQTNYPGSTVAVSTSGTQVTVSVHATTPTFFGKFLGLESENVGAKAVAGEVTTSTPCSPGINCYAIFAMDQSCSGTGVTFNGGGYDIKGGVHSNGSINTGGGGSSYGPTTYGTGCTKTTGGGDTFTSGPTAEAPVTTWPINYATDFPACGGSGEAACGPSGTPSYCSASAASFTFTNSSPPSSGYIYCAYGTGTESNPTTWNGTIAFTGGSIGSSGSPVVATYVAGNVYTNSGSEFLEACGYGTTGYVASTCQGTSTQTPPNPVTSNYPVIYAVDTDTQAAAAGDTYAVNLGGGGNSWQGDIFAPNGTVDIAAGSQTTGFIEGNDVYFLSGGITGDGPSANGTGSSTSSESLLQ
jgi:hypothetical protein